MSIEVKAFKGASWLAFFKLISQIFSWVITILVARILVPGDYGLMEMSTIITGYAAIFNELGLGAAIIQRPQVNQRELSSVFWFGMTFSVILAGLCFVVAYPTAMIFNEPRVVPVTQVVSVLFILTGLQIVPLSLMQKELEFKKTGFIEMIGVFVSCIAMFVIAKSGGGVWTLIGGHMIREFVKFVMVYYTTRWMPRLHFNYAEARAYLSFGITVALGQSLFYVYDKSDKFFAGKAWAAQALGYYSFALQLAKIPTEKIVVLINQVSYPVFAKFQDDPENFNRFYLNIIKITSTLVLPVFVGGFLVGEDIIKILLNEKWYPIIGLFKYLCLAQILTSLNAINNFVHIAQGRPRWSLWFNSVMAVGMPISFFVAVHFTLMAILVPWFSTYLFICGVWVIITLRTIRVPIKKYFLTILTPLIATLVMAMGITVLANLWQVPHGQPLMHSIRLLCEIVVGALCYGGYLWIFDPTIFTVLEKLRKPDM